LVTTFVAAAGLVIFLLPGVATDAVVATLVVSFFLAAGADASLLSFFGAIDNIKAI
jgi:hypothetical protein